MYVMSIMHNRETMERWMQLSSAFYYSIDIEANSINTLDTYFGICYI